MNFLPKIFDIPVFFREKEGGDCPFFAYNEKKDLCP